MRDIRVRIIAGLLGLLYATVANAQQLQPNAAVPKLVRFSGSFHAANGTPAHTMESVTLSVYRDQTSGDALWHEIQNVVVDADGHYSVLMGATLTSGMPVELFASGEPRWLGVQFDQPGEAEQPRVLLVSVPYALKAADSETLGGRPASAYMLASPTVGADTARENVAAATAAKPKADPVNSGLPNYIGKFVTTSDLISSAMYEVNGNVGIFTTTPAISLDVRTGTLPQMGIAGATDYLTFFASDQYGPAIYWDPAKDMRFGKGGSGLYNPYGFVEQMRIQSGTGNVGIGTMTPVVKLDVAGDINFTGMLGYQGMPVLRLGGPYPYNIAVGLGALNNNVSGSYDTAFGDYALQSNTTGLYNVASGAWALSSNTEGNYDTAIGDFANYNNTTGGKNTSLGYSALWANTTGENNIAIGNFAARDVDGGNSNNIHFGTRGLAGDNGTIRIGDSSMQTFFFGAGIRGVTTANNDAIPVVIDSAGQLGTVSSSRRFKEDIDDMGEASRELMRLRPVRFRYKQPFADGSKPIQYGLIAEEVADVYPDLVAHSADGKIETVKYQVLDSMLLNEVQRQQAEIGAQRDEIRHLQLRLARIEAASSTNKAKRNKGESR